MADGNWKTNETLIYGFHFHFQSKTTLRYLLNTQMLQEEEINLKINSLKIDMDCMTVRESLKFKEY